MGKSTAKVSGFELKSVNEFKQEEKAASQLPEPQGYKILIAIPNPEETTEGGIIKSSQTLENERVSSVVGLVLALGKDAYADEKRFPNGPYCKEGDLILMRAYSGTRIKIHEKEFRLINDDSVEAKIDDPRGIQRL